MSSSNKQIVVDAQVLQTSAWERGMGKYTFSLLKALHDREEYDVTLLFNTNLSFNDEMRSRVSAEMPRFSTHDINLLTPSSKKVKDIQQKNEEILDRFLNKAQLNNEHVSFLIPCLFLGPACPVFPSGTKNVLLMHDIIPLQFFERYFPMMHVQDYLAHFKTLFKADHVVTISQSVRDDMLVYLGLEGKKVTVIDSAAAITTAPETDAEFRQRYTKPFVLMPTGNDLRKNNQRCAAAFQSFLDENGADLQLVITSHFTDFEKEELNRLSRNLVFTDNISDDELAWLYKHSEFVLFAAENEGLGMPLLEAAEFKKRVVCSDIPVFREVSPDAFIFVDPYNTGSIQTGIKTAYDQKGHPVDNEGYVKIAAKYNWRQVAHNLDRSLGIAIKEPVVNKPRIAVLGPKPSSYSAIGKTLLELHPALSRRFDIDYYFETSIVEDKKVRPNYLPYVTNCYDVKEFNAKRYAEYDAVIYHMGNSENHLVTAQHALALPGIIIVHDTHMPGLFKFLKEERVMDVKRVELEEQLNTFVKEGKSSYITSLTNAQLGLIVHSEYTKQTVSELLEKPVEVKRANLTFANPAYNAQVLDRGKLRIGLGGILAGVKGLEIIESIATEKVFSDCIIEVFGFNFAEKGLLERLQSLPTVRISTNLSDYEFQTTLASLNVLVNYRMEYRGETSCTVLEAMRYGVIPVVRNIGWYSELPDNTAVKVDSLDDVLPALRRLIGDKTERMNRAVAAKEMIDREFLHEYYVDNIYDLMQEIRQKDGTINARIAASAREGQSVGNIMKIIET
ncbi:hypothetical protein CYG49_02860 [Candidatus Saccharibacteria bacterium]|nr:MAG: hypothetical protein CYG49_02860 [Candidatus Saccharibacteria bacterium]